MRRLLYVAPFLLHRDPQLLASHDVQDHVHTDYNLFSWLFLVSNLSNCILQPDMANDEQREGVVDEVRGREGRSREDLGKNLKKEVTWDSSCLWHCTVKHSA